MSAPDEKKRLTTLELFVNNHPGVMSHVCGLFSRRAYNLEGIICLPVGDGTTSKILLQVSEDKRLDQVIKQVRKLADVEQVNHCEEIHSPFKVLDPFFGNREDA